MAVSTPSSRKEVALKIFADIQANLPSLNPFLRNSLIRALATGIAGRIFDAYKKIDLLQQEFFLQTATDLTFIRRWGYLKNIDLKAAGVATGNVSMTGVASTIIPLGTILVSEAQYEYVVVDNSFVIVSTALNITSLVSDGFGIITATCGVDHNFTNAMTVVISGATPSTFNGTYTILSVTSSKIFTVSKVITAGTATGTITATVVSANVSIESVLTGLDKNLDSGALLTLKTGISGVDDNCYVQFLGISGGADVETSDAYRLRTIDRWRNPIAVWNVAFIESIVLSVLGVTRVWVYGTTPSIGEVTILFVRDDDPDIIPNPNEVLAVKTELLKYRPADRDALLIHVTAPTRLPINFSFSALTPDSQSMRKSIEDALLQFFRESVNVGVSISQDAYRSVIWQAINPETGEHVTSFTLSTPTSAITVGTNELPDLGTVSWI